MTDTWAAKVLDGVPRYKSGWRSTHGEDIRYDDALAALAKLGAGDGLVERLLSWDGCWPAPWIERALPEAAARIAALTKEREQWRRAAETRAKGWKISDDARIEAEAKLEKAVKGLKRICMQPDYRLPSPQEIARTTLAEIKGESHE